ncbi:MAG TPA: TRAP transporter small permease [Firmicutes bacterium]|jgi:TRAP-type C4-dicarboxylate transport system permease small subunit|nr:TRAP transporter small permease [Bacillota bacterium]
MPVIKKIIYGFNGYILKIALLFTVLMMFVTVGDVVARSFFNKPIPGIFELTRYALAVIVFTSLGWSQMSKVHIAINLFVSRLSALWQNGIDTFNYLLAFITFVISFWQMVAYTIRLFNYDVVTTVLRVHVYPWVLISAVGILFFALALFLDLADAINRLVEREGKIDEPGSFRNS